MRIPLPSEQWRNLKTMKLVRIVSLAKDEESSETVVNFTFFDPRDPDASNLILYSRPLAHFTEKLDVGRHSGNGLFGPAELHPIGQ
jgi:hypothetical protein